MNLFQQVSREILTSLLPKNRVPGMRRVLESKGFSDVEALSPYKTLIWPRLTPRERLRRCWRMRARVANLRVLHDQKLFPKP